MNLNKNPQFEYFNCTWDPNVVGLLAGIAEEIWRCPELAEAAAMRPQEHGNIFGGLGPANAPRAPRTSPAALQLARISLSAETAVRCLLSTQNGSG